MILFLFLSIQSIWSQESATITFTVRDVETEQPIINVYLSDANQKTVGISNERGVISFSATNSRFWVTSHVAYQPDTIFLKDLQASNVLLLTPAENSLATVAIVAKRASYGSVATLSEREIKSVPTLLGEADPLRAALRIAGVESGGEVSSRLHVRGGLPGENLTLLDGVPIYNETHVGPLFSVFNADVLRQFSVYKIAAPAEKGSGISALLDAETKLPSFTEPEKKLNIGPINSSFYLNGPWKNSERTALAIGVRGSPLSLFSILSKPENLRNALLIKLGDFNAALRHKLSPKSELIGRVFGTYDEGISATQTNFSSNPDIVDLRESFSVGWSNRGYSLTYQHSFNQKWTSKIQVYGAQYRYRIKETAAGRDASGQLIESSAFSFQGRVDDSGLRFLLERTYATGQLKLGLNAKQQESLPVAYEERPEALALLSSPRNSRRVDGFFNLEQSLSDKTKLSLSGKLNAYWTDGYQVYLPTGFISLQRKFGAQVSAKITGERIAQFEHALPAFGGAWQLNAWLLASEFAPAAVADRVEVSFNYTLGKYVNVTQAVYFRSAANLIRTATEDFTELLRNDQVSAEECCATDGQAQNYGLETSLNYQSPSVEFGVNYTLARSEHTFARINSGRPFSPRFDRRHSFNLWLSKPLANNRWLLNAQFIYQSGIAYTSPIAVIPGIGIGSVPVFDRINNARFPAVHRLDVGLDRNWIGRNGNQNTISFGAYNVYNRANPINFSFEGNGRIFPSPTRFPITRSAAQLTAEGAFGFLPYVSFRKTFVRKDKP